ncbi:DNA repair protein [Mannheimia granulomatis]|uniref:type II toxin-antitoxin system HicB family antitoxin n=1 Tax=Mannheimia TaxID=75984 RepID=UPI00046C9D19|nr:MULTISPECIES: type II toxin-antitoxin system HicB family antitoxin [Mannheimia]QLB14348.1 DNA repair protein [Mannheimia granulomatis]
MRNIMEINGYKAVIAYDPETELFRGEFIGLNGGADFYADNVAQLKKEGEISLNVFLEMCEKKNIEPFKQYSGKFNIRLSPELHKAAVMAATAENLSLNEWISQTLAKSV